MTPRTIFIIQGIIMFFAMKNRRRLYISGCVMKPEGLRGVLKQIIRHFHSSEWMQVGRRGDYNYRDITQKETETWDTV